MTMAMALLAAPLAAQGHDGPPHAQRQRPARDRSTVAPGQAASSWSWCSPSRPSLHINGPSAGDDGLIPTKVSFTAPRGISFAPPGFPPAHEAKVQFSDKPVKVYSDKVSLAPQRQGGATAPSRGAMRSRPR